MSIKTVLFTDRPTAERNAGQPDWAVISICGIAVEAALRPGWLAVLRLEFDDTELASSPMSFQMHHALSIDDFVAKAGEHGATGVLVHCHAGQSRSAAVAKWISLKYGLPFDHHYELFNRHVFEILHQMDESKK